MSSFASTRSHAAGPIPFLHVFDAATGAWTYTASFRTGEDVANVEVFLEVPLFDWNQGTVKQAESDLFRQQGEIRRTELVLRRRLGDRYRQYITAWQHVENYEQVILPESVPDAMRRADGTIVQRTAPPSPEGRSRLAE